MIVNVYKNIAGRYTAAIGYSKGDDNLPENLKVAVSKALLDAAKGVVERYNKYFGQ